MASASPFSSPAADAGGLDESDRANGGDARDRKGRGAVVRGEPRCLLHSVEASAAPVHPSIRRCQHARYSGDAAKIEIAKGAVIAGSLPGRALRLVREWVQEHRDELEANWERAVRYEETKPIEPRR
jgi:Domain of unknown function (DUF4160)